VSAELSVDLITATALKPVVVDLDPEARSIDLDLGIVPGDEKSDHRLALRNSTDRAIRIVEIRPACGCVVTSGGVGELPSGGETFLDFKLPSSRFVGASVKTIALTFEDGHQIALRLITKVAADVTCSAEVIVFDAQRNSSSINIDALGNHVTIEDASVIGGSVKSTQISAVPASIQLKLEQSSNAESLTDLVRVRYLKNSQQFVRDFPLQVKNLVDYRAVPRELVIANSVQDHSLRGSVRIAGRDSVRWISPRNLLIVDAHGKSLGEDQVSIDVEVASQRLVKVSIQAHDRRALAGSTWVLRLMNNDSAVFECPIRVSIR